MSHLSWQRGGALVGLSLATTVKLLLSLGLVTSVTGCCGWNPFGTTLEPDVRDTYLSAVRDPETFDSRVTSLAIPEGTPACLREIAAEAFELEEQQILTCDAFLTGTVSWNRCFDEADHIHNHGVILGDVANAIEGGRSFASSQGGSLLLLSKGVLGAQFYEALIDEFSVLTPDMQCDLGCQ